MQLAHDWPSRLSDDARGKIQSILDAGCRHCGGAFASLVLRRIGGGRSIYLQCLTCGASLGNPHARQQHPNWPDYPPWNEHLAETGPEELHAARQAKWAANADARRDAYATFLQSDEWRALRKRVIARASGICEACLERPATEVHHVSYELGWLPPAWLLRAVCRECHDRFDLEGDEWGPPEGDVP